MSVMSRTAALKVPARARGNRVDRDSSGALFHGYLDPDGPYAAAYDEMFAADGTVRSFYRALYESIAGLHDADLAARSAAIDRALADQGITFSLSGKERPLP